MARDALSTPCAGESQRRASVIEGGTLMFVAAIVAVIHAVTAEQRGHTLAIVTGEREEPTLLCGWLSDGIAFTRPLIALKLHPVGAAAHPLEVGCWVAEVAAVPVGMGGPGAVVRPSLQVRVIRFDLHQAADATSNDCHIATIRFPDSDNSAQSPVC